MDKLLKRTLNEKIRTQRYPSRSYYSLMAEKECIRLSAETGEFTRVSGACNGEFGGIAVSHVAHFASEIALSGAIILTLLLVCSFSPRVHSIPRGPR